MIENYPQAEAGMAIGRANGGLVGTQSDRTVSENIDAKISMLKKEIERLEASKKTLAPLMDMRIRDIREAMSY